MSAERIALTLAEARALPNMLGRIVPVMLRAHGTYTCIINGRRVVYVRAEGETR